MGGRDGASGGLALGSSVSHKSIGDAVGWKQLEIKCANGTKGCSGGVWMCLWRGTNWGGGYDVERRGKVESGLLMEPSRKTPFGGFRDGIYRGMGLWVQQEDGPGVGP